MKLASGSWDKILVWRTDNTELILTINGHTSLVRSVAWSPDGQQLISASKDKTVKFWDSCTGRQIGQPCTGHTGHITSHAISYDGSFIATASESDDKTVRLWNTRTRQQVGQALKHTNWVYCVAISPDGELLGSSGVDGVIYLWSIGEMLQRRDGRERQKEKLQSERRPAHTSIPDDVQVCSIDLSISFSLPQLPQSENEEGKDRVRDEKEESDEDEFFDVSPVSAYLIPLASVIKHFLYTGACDTNRGQ